MQQGIAEETSIYLYLPAIMAEGNSIVRPPDADWWQPGPGTSWQIQFTGQLDTSLAVDMYDIDLHSTSDADIAALRADGKVVICYFSAGSWENFRPDRNLYPEEILGKTLDGWPGERWVDIRRIDLLGPLLEARMDTAVYRGCDGVEPDNVDGFINDTGFSLSFNDQLTFNKWLAREAHARKLSIGLKNNLEQVKDLVADFDWALNESCFRYNECQLLLPFINAGKAVFGIEYTLATGEFCPRANEYGFDFLRKNLELDAWRVSCR